MSRLCQVKASAGSGKTYELTRCFLLRLMECGHASGVAASPACALAPEGRQCGWGDILAVTFYQRRRPLKCATASSAT